MDCSDRGLSLVAVIVAAVVARGRGDRVLVAAAAATRVNGMASSRITSPLAFTNTGENF